MKRISVIIPCFNHGVYIVDAIASLQLESHADLFEVIIVNDGSTDAHTLDVLTTLSEKGIQVIHQPNAGLGNARNKGVEQATSTYLLPLDCDNTINPDVFKEAADWMDAHAEIDAVYTDVKFFGNKQVDVSIGPFDFKRLVVNNYIDACALIRRSTFLKFQGYAVDMPYMGHEDWELWIKFAVNNCVIHYLPKQGFSYRVRNDSMLRSLNDDKLRANRQYIYVKYATHLAGVLAEAMSEYRTLQEQAKKLDRINRNTFRSAIKLLIGKAV